VLGRALTDQNPSTPEKVNDHLQPNAKAIQGMTSAAKASCELTRG
jgi:hypothetical protein